MPPGDDVASAATDRERVIAVFLTGPTRDQLEALATRLVEERLAACVNILPDLTSVYRWRGRVERDTEALAIVKTVARLLPRLEARVRDLHSYDLPEVLAIESVGGSRAYLDWIVDSVESRSGDGAA
ncbi:MAG: divalent-cation tolerance protein CutA [Gemmatimonadota bacterium]|jgi:periplasmic divalent cation tolerance protein